MRGKGSGLLLRGRLTCCRCDKVTDGEGSLLYRWGRGVAQVRVGVLKYEGAGKGCSPRVRKGMCPPGSRWVRASQASRSERVGVGHPLEERDSFSEKEGGVTPG